MTSNVIMEPNFAQSCHFTEGLLRTRTEHFRFGMYKFNEGNEGKTPNIATEFAEIAEIPMVFLKIAKIAISLRKKNTVQPRFPLLTPTPRLVTQF